MHIVTQLSAHTCCVAAFGDREYGFGEFMPWGEVLWSVCWVRTLGWVFAWLLSFDRAEEDCETVRARSYGMQYCTGVMRKSIYWMKNTGVMCFNLLCFNHQSTLESAELSSNIASSNIASANCHWGATQNLIPLSKAPPYCCDGKVMWSFMLCWWETAWMFYVIHTVTSQVLIDCVFTCHMRMITFAHRRLCLARFVFSLFFHVCCPYWCICFFS